jgi:hypothetical protein
MCRRLLVLSQLKKNGNAPPVSREWRVQNMSGIELDELIYRIRVALDHL